MVDCEVFKHIGNMSQIVSVIPMMLTEGKSFGVKCISVEGRSGLSFILVQDRAMDIAQLRYKGLNISYMTANGIPSYSLYGTSDKRFDTNPFLGMMTTCGLDNTGPACIDGGRDYYQHGRLSNTPAENVVIKKNLDNLSPELSIECDISLYQLGNYNLRLHRNIMFLDKDSCIRVHDTVFNESGSEQQVCIMYHCNFGYPFLDENVLLDIPSYARKYKGFEDKTVSDDDVLRVLHPNPDWKPQVIYHMFDGDGLNTVRIKNLKQNVSVALSFDGSTLPYMNQWRMFRDREFVLSLEPCNTIPYGRASQKEKHMAKFIEPYGKRDYFIEFKIKENC